MIAALIDSLRALAHEGGPPIGDPPRHRELADAFADAYLLATTCQQVRLTAAELEALDTVDRLLEREPRDWTGVPSAARAALHALGHVSSTENDLRT